MTGNTFTTRQTRDDAITFAKIQNVNTGVVLGRTSAGVGDTEQLTAGSGITISGGQISAQSVVNTGNILWVDIINGNNGTALPDRLDKPYADPWAALVAASSDDVVMIMPGSYTLSGASNPNLIKSGVSIQALGRVQIINNTTSTTATLEQTNPVFDPMYITGDIEITGSGTSPDVNITDGVVNIDISRLDISYTAADQTLQTAGMCKISILAGNSVPARKFIFAGGKGQSYIQSVAFGGNLSFETSAPSLRVERATSDGGGTLSCVSPGSGAQAVLDINSVENFNILTDGASGYAKMRINEARMTSNGLSIRSTSTSIAIGDLLIDTLDAGTGAALGMTIIADGSSTAKLRINNCNSRGVALDVQGKSTGTDEIDLGNLTVNATGSVSYTSSQNGTHYVTARPRNHAGNLQFSFTDGANEINLLPGDVSGGFGVSCTTTPSSVKVNLPSQGELFVSGAPLVTSPVTTYISLAGTGTRIVTGRLRSTSGTSATSVVYWETTGGTNNIINNLCLVAPSANFTYPMHGNALGVTVNGAGRNTFNIDLASPGPITMAGATYFWDAGVK